MTGAGELVNVNVQISGYCTCTKLRLLYMYKNPVTVHVQKANKEWKSLNNCFILIMSVYSEVIDTQKSIY